MKSLLRNIIVNSFALWLTSFLINGLVIKGGFDVILFGGIALTLMNLLVKPILSLLTLPLTIITMGLFSWLVNVAIIYLLTIFVSQISLTAYTFPGFNGGGISLPQISVPAFFTAVLVAFMISFISNSFAWLFRR
ncbi:phage holin family protein [Candidatus Microgenomates bacterium]|nr:phage holin family protein [Candidatus Microgenomates bacterium]